MNEPIYKQVADSLRAAILEGEYRAHDILPSENELAEQYSTSRVTIRRGLSTLENEGLIKPWHGKGYFVQPPSHTRYTLFFGDSIGENTAKYREITIIPADPEVSAALGIEKGAWTVVTKRLIEREGKPVAHDEKYIVYHKGTPSVELEIDYAEFPDIFAGRFVPMSISTRMEIGVEIAPDYVCRALGCKKESHLMVVYRFISTMEGGVIGYGKQYLADGYGRISAQSGFYTSQKI